MRSSYQFVFFTLGVMLLVEGVAMVVPAMVDIGVDSPESRAFLLSGFITCFLGGVLAISNYNMEPVLSQREAYILTVLAWLSTALLGSLPLVFALPSVSFTDVFFETMSALTTTGSTVLTGLDTMPPGILLWRSLLQWMGGIGIVVMVMIMLPLLRVGGMQLFKTESSDISGKGVPRIKQIVAMIGAVYLILTFLCAVCYAVAGMTNFDAINHAMTTIATGGFSTKDASIGFYNSLPVEIVGIVFMTASALPLIFYAYLIFKGPKHILNERQIPLFLILLMVAISLVTVWNMFYNAMPFATALRLSSFNVTSILTDTGFATTDFSTWGSFAVGVFFFLFFIGGCAGSTAGAIKIFRWQILFKDMIRQVKQAFSPRRVIAVHYGKEPLESATIISVKNFFFMYLLTFAFFTLIITATGLDFMSSSTAVAQAMANAGPGLGPVVGPGTNFASIPSLAKWMLVLAMLLGRLELTTMYVLLIRDFWR